MVNEREEIKRGIQYLGGGEGRGVNTRGKRLAFLSTVPAGSGSVQN
jgi:hypothetical protein